MRNDTPVSAQASAPASAPVSAPVSAQTPLPRPENRCRGGRESVPLWDSLPACLRSEAFAEDLPLAAWAVPAPSVGRAGALAPALSLLFASLPLLSSR